MRILIIEPLNLTAGMLQQRLRHDGHYVDRTPCGKKGSEIWRGGQFDMLIMDWEPEEYTAPEVLADLLGAGKLPSRVIVYSPGFSPDSGSMEDRAQQIAPLIPLKRVVFLSKRDPLFFNNVREFVANVVPIKQE